MRVIINIDVPNLASAIDFYSAALGLQLNRIIEEDVAELIGVSSVIYLLQNPAGSHPVNTRSLVRDYARHWTPVHMDFVVDDVIEASKRAMDAGAIRESECIEWNGSTTTDCMHRGFSPRLWAIASNTVLTMVTSSVCMKNPMATNHNNMSFAFLSFIMTTIAS